MYTGYQEEMFKNPWGVNEGFKHLQEKLDELVPAMGACEFPRSKNKNLEKFRQASNAAYDLFNNGLCNRKQQFKKIFGWSVSPKITCYATTVTWKQWEGKVEEVMTPIILAAAKEQGVK